MIIKIIINKEKAKDFIFDKGKLRTPMYFESLSEDAKEVFKALLESGNLYTYQISEDVPTFSRVIQELLENGYIYVLEL